MELSDDMASGRGVKRPHSPTTFEANGPPQDQSPESTTEPKKEKVVRSQASSAFRNVSACNRCRNRKNRCDQRLPACKPCEKAGVKCTSFDPLLGRETPRSYVYYLESRSAYLEDLLTTNNIDFQSAESFALDKRSDTESTVKKEQTSPQTTVKKPGQAKGEQETEEDRVDRLISNVGLVSVQGASDPRYLGSTSGISFARVVFSAIRGSVNRSPSNKSGRNSKVETAAPDIGSSGSMRDSVFGLQTKTTIRPAPFPDEEIARKLANLYFQHPHPQIPVLHKPSFTNMLDRVYKRPDRARTPRESYFLNIVFAIGAGTIVDNPQKDDTAAEEATMSKKVKLSGQRQPEEYHAAAVAHLVAVLESSSTETRDGVSDALEELQAVLLLANFALLRPVAPGLWYITGVAVRLAVDLGLHHEDGQDDAIIKNSSGLEPDAATIGRKQWLRELRRRLWWCVYSFDRLVGVCVGRPFSISDQVITTEFPSLLDDRYISPAGFQVPPDKSFVPSSKFVTHHYLRLRLLQSEIMQVLQHVNAKYIYLTKTHAPNEYMYTGLESPFLQPYESFSHWRTDVDRRLWEWKESAPSQQQTGVHFSPLFYELNYNQAVIMLYRPSLTAPAELAKELDSYDVAESPGATSHLDSQGDEEFVCLKIAEAGQKVLKLYRQLHRHKLVNYTYLSTHALFMAGISFLYAIFHSPVVRSHLSLDDVDFTVLAATSVLSDMIENCPPAEACKEAFENMSKATIQMCMSTTGFGPGAAQAQQHRPTTARSSSSNTNRQPGLQRTASAQAGVRQAFDSTSFSIPQQGSVPRFDMNLSDLFSEAETKMQAINRPSNGLEFPGNPQQQYQQQHVQQQTRRKATYQPPRLAASVSTNARNLYENQSLEPNFGVQNQVQARQQQSFRPPMSTTETAGFGNALRTSSNNYNDPQGVVENELHNNMDFLNDPTLNGMFGGVGGGGASLFDGSRINEWNMDGQDWNNMIGNADEQGVMEQAGQGSGSGIDMFGGLFFG